MRVLLFMGLLSGCANWDSLSELYKGDGGVVDVDDAAQKVDGDSEHVDGGTATAGDMAMPQADGAIAADMACKQYIHSNGIGGLWTDCVPLGTYDNAQALKACEASYTDCLQETASNPCAGKAIYGYGSPGNYGTWVYAGTYIGQEISGDCLTPETEASWN